MRRCNPSENDHRLGLDFSSMLFQISSSKTLLNSLSSLSLDSLEVHQSTRMRAAKTHLINTSSSSEVLEEFFLPPRNASRSTTGPLVAHQRIRKLFPVYRPSDGQLWSLRYVTQLPMARRYLFNRLLIGSARTAAEWPERGESRTMRNLKF